MEEVWIPLAASVAALFLTVIVAGFLQHAALRFLPSVSADGTPGAPIPASLFLVRALSTQCGLLIPALLAVGAFPGRIRLRMSASEMRTCVAGCGLVLAANVAGSFAVRGAGEAYTGLPALPRDGPGIAAILATTVVSAPAVEELFFREALLSRIFAPWTRPLALAASSLAFGALHAGVGGPVALATLSLIGLALGWIRERTGSLGAAIAVHAANNVFALLIAGLGSS